MNFQRLNPRCYPFSRRKRIECETDFKGQLSKLSARIKNLSNYSLKKKSSRWKFTESVRQMKNGIPIKTNYNDWKSSRGSWRKNCGMKTGRRWPRRTLWRRVGGTSVFLI